jgi:hypothetical protein
MGLPVFVELSVAAAKSHSFPPMFVPSLSWYNQHVYA